MGVPHDAMGVPPDTTGVLDQKVRSKGSIPGWAIRYWIAKPAPVTVKNASTTMPTMMR